MRVMLLLRSRERFHYFFHFLSFLAINIIIPSFYHDLFLLSFPAIGFQRISQQTHRFRKTIVNQTQLLNLLAPVRFHVFADQFEHLFGAPRVSKI